MEKISLGELNRRSQFVAVVMAGGSGTRFWPLSRQRRPKQVLPLSPNGQTLIAATCARIEEIPQRSSVLIVTSHLHKQLIMEQVPGAAMLLEPFPRNTAPCAGIAALRVLKEVGDVPMLCLPADHLISGIEGLVRVYSECLELAASKDVLITIGIPPAFPETGYGYIEGGEELPEGARVVRSFKEKPDLKTAQHYVESGAYYWNSGMFVWRPSVILRALESFEPELRRDLDAFMEAASVEAASLIFEKIKSISIDYAVMERAKNVLVVPGTGFKWSDIGSWSAWADSIRESNAQEGDNVTVGDTLAIDCSATTLFSSGKLVVGVGLSDLVVVETEDAVLVCKSSSAQDVKRAVDLLKEKKRESLL